MPSRIELALILWAPLTAVVIFLFYRCRYRRRGRHKASLFDVIRRRAGPDNDP